MYSGTTFNKKSGSFLGVHQRIDRIARLKIEQYRKGAFFPEIKNILHFEGKNGPDGIKRKSPARDEPWHYIDPTLPSEGTLLVQISNHQLNLKQAIKVKDEHRAAFEAAWLAHCVVDGLTPAHHYPLEEKLERLRGESLLTRTSLRKKLIISGNSPRQRVKNNWEIWGARGMMTSHVLFELGVASAMTPANISKIVISKIDIETLKNEGFETIFCRHLAQIHTLKMYDTFRHKGWTRQLARQTRRDLIPVIIQSVALAWLSVLVEPDS